MVFARLICVCRRKIQELISSSTIIASCEIKGQLFERYEIALQLPFNFLKLPEIVHVKIFV